MEGNELLVEENQVNNLLESGITRIRGILENQKHLSNSKYPNLPNFSESSLFNNFDNNAKQNRQKNHLSQSNSNEFQSNVNNCNNNNFNECENNIEPHYGANLEKLRFKNMELNDYLYEVKRKNNELLHLIGLQKNDFKELDVKYCNVSGEYHQLYDRLRQSETIRQEQVNLIQVIQNELDVLRGYAIQDEKNIFSNQCLKESFNDNTNDKGNDEFEENLQISGGKYKEQLVSNKKELIYNNDINKEKKNKKITSKKIKKSSK